MKTRLVLATIAALSLGAGSFAFAQDQRGEQRDQNRTDQRQQNQRDQTRSDQSPQYRGDERVQNRSDQRQNNRYAQPGQYRGDASVQEGRGAGPDHAFYRGGRMPSEYRGRQYVVDDWRGHHLNAPPRGYQWVQSGSDYVLVAIATGVIASILLNQ